jgi:hypothetical protein
MPQIRQHQIIDFSRNLFPTNLKDYFNLVNEYRQMFDLIVSKAALSKVDLKAV